jgi:hypothetical protein
MGGDGRSDGLADRREHGEHRIALARDERAAVGRDGLAEHEEMLAQQCGNAVPRSRTSRVEPSMSVMRKATVPRGRSVIRANDYE